MIHVPHLLTLKLPGTDPGETPYTVNAPTGFAFNGMGLADVLNKAILFVFAFAGMGLLVMLIMAGFTYLTSAGDAKKLSQAQAQLTNAIIGFIIIFCAFWIVQLVGTIFGIQPIIGTGSVFGK